MRGNKWFDKERERERKKSITGTNLIGKGEREAGYWWIQVGTGSGFPLTCSVATPFGVI